MHQRYLIRSAWASAGLDQSNDARLKTLIDSLAETTEDLWGDLSQRLRGLDDATKVALLLALWKTGDAVVRLNLVEVLDPKRPDELKLLNRFVREADAIADSVELYAIAQRGDAELLNRVIHKKGLAATMKNFLKHSVSPE